MSYFDSAEYKKKENYFLEKIKKSTTYSAFIKDAFEDLEEEANGTVDIFMLGIEAFNLESVEIDCTVCFEKNLLKLLITTPRLESICLLKRFGLSVTSVYSTSYCHKIIFYIVKGVNGYEILKKKGSDDYYFLDLF